VYFGIDYARGGRILAADISADYGNKAWELMTQGGLTAAPALHSNILYFGAEDGHVYAISVEKEMAWPMENSRFDARGRITADVAVDEFAVYATVTNGTVYALDRSNGKIKWQYFAQGGLRDPAVPGATQVYVHVPGTGLVAIDKINGLFTRQPKWVVPEGRQVLSEDNERVYLRARDNSILAVNKSTGKVVFQSARNDYQLFATDLSSATIYAATRGGRLTAITPVLRPGMIGHLALLEQAITPAPADRPY
jgi:outer membrane protein assembly factor BamB